MKQDKVIIAMPIYSMQRFDSLKNAVETLQAGTYKNVHPVIVSDGNKEVYKRAKKEIHNTTILLNEKHRDWVYSVNMIFRDFDAPYYIYAADDLIFPENCVECAMKTMKERFPDGFGCVTIGKKVRTNFALLGRKFIDHFPERQVMCPDFIHYGGDSEVQRMVEHLGIFAYPPDRKSQVKHFRNKDDTWRIARKVRARDHRIFYKRISLGYIWGVDFNRVT
jgi:hypothetical protein